ncbi:MAG: HAMP domain-containing histidine kinase [Polyangiaceae bacterium]|nr:HAMP domain-containing histidine kinase [Polyangiaceae bacterium]
MQPRTASPRARRARAKIGGSVRAAPGARANGKSKVLSGGSDPLLLAICHDLRAPLAAVTMGANFVLQTTPNDQANARTLRILEAMLRSCAQMERLVRNFADFSEIDGGSVSLRMGTHDAGDMIELTADAARESAQVKDVALDVHKPSVSMTVRCDRERVLRALGHIVENAVRFAPEGSAIELTVAPAQGGAVDFAVKDHGPGLAPDMQKNLFDRGWHAARAKRAGAGFGLAIARGFANAHGGNLSVTSRANKETVFTFSLPIRGPKQSPSRRGA